jgi:hypothetical protein
LWSAESYYIFQHLSFNSQALSGTLDRVRVISHNFGYGVGDDMGSLLMEY